VRLIVAKLCQCGLEEVRLNDANCSRSGLVEGLRIVAKEPQCDLVEDELIAAQKHQYSLAEVPLNAV
jgi:hypothetical protein